MGRAPAGVGDVVGRSRTRQIHFMHLANEVAGSLGALASLVWGVLEGHGSSTRRFFLAVFGPLGFHV